MSGVPQGGFLAGVDSVGDVVDRGLGVGGVVIGEDEAVDGGDVEGEIVDGGMGGGGGEVKARGFVVYCFGMAVEWSLCLDRYPATL
jgi:hypothetical protein